MRDNAHPKLPFLIFLVGLALCWVIALGRGQSDLRPEDFVYVCRNAGAGGYEAFPDVCRLRDGRLMAVMMAIANITHNALYFRPIFCGPGRGAEYHP